MKSLCSQCGHVEHGADPELTFEQNHSVYAAAGASPGRRFAIGDRVEHERLGHYGTVVELGQNYTLTVEFDGDGWTTADECELVLADVQVGGAR